MLQSDPGRLGWWLGGGRDRASIEQSDSSQRSEPAQERSPSALVGCSPSHWSPLSPASCRTPGISRGATRRRLHAFVRQVRLEIQEQCLHCSRGSLDQNSSVLFSGVVSRFPVVLPQAALERQDTDHNRRFPPSLSVKRRGRWGAISGPQSNRFSGRRYRRPRRWSGR